MEGGTCLVAHEGTELHDIVACLERQVAQLQAEVAELRKPDFYWPDGAEDCPVDGPREPAEEAWPEAVILRGAKQLDYEVYLDHGPDADEWGCKCLGKFKSLAEAQEAAKAAKENGA